MRYAVMIENAGANYSAYVPELRGCIATGATIEAVEHRIRGAIEMHLAGMREDSDQIQPPSSQMEYMDVAA
jgi:predicted RNase H-like HicB family nuclease